MPKLYIIYDSFNKTSIIQIIYRIKIFIYKGRMFHINTQE